MGNIQTGPESVNPAQVRDLMTRLQRELADKAIVKAIIADILTDDLGRVRELSDLSANELRIGRDKLMSALGEFEPDKVCSDLEARIRANNEALRGEANKTRPVVELKPSFLPQAIKAVERILLNESRDGNVRDRIFQRDGQLVRLSRNLVPPGEKHDDGYMENNALLIVPITPGWLANRLDRSIQFVGASAGNPNKQAKPDDGKKKRKLVPKNASRELVIRMLEDSSNWRHPALFGTIEAPTLRDDGTVLDTPGYDKRTGLFFDPGVTEFPIIPARPSRADGIEAMQLLDGLLVDFPFQDAPGYEGVSRAVALAAILTGPVRRTLKIAPAFAITAKEAETGKTELSKLIAAITTGREVSGQPFSGNEEERRKAIGAYLRSGQPILFFDNADNVVIEGDFLENVITSSSIEDRILQQTEKYTAPTNCLILFNGNHITISGAMTTRVLLSRIVTEEPLWLRSFHYRDLLGHVIENRPELVAAVLTALRAWLVHGERDPKRPTSRFAQWDDLIAQALIWYGYADPMRGGDELREADPAKDAKRTVVRTWAKIFGDATVTALDLFKQAEVRQAIANARNLKERELTAMHVAKYIATTEGVRLDLDWRVVRHAKVSGEPAQWHLDFTGEGGGDPPEPESAETMDASAAEDFAEVD